MPAIGTQIVFQLTDNQLLGGVVISNVYHYLQVGGAFADQAVNVANAYDNQILVDIVPTQVTAMTHTSIVVEQLGSLTNYAEYDPTNNAGEYSTGQTMPTYVAARYDFLRETKETRQGYKRIAGVPEEGVNGNSLEVAYRTLCGDAADSMAAGLSTSFTHVPVILGKRYEVVDGERVLLPVSDWIYNLVSDVIVNIRPTSQVSRKAPFSV